MPNIFANSPMFVNMQPAPGSFRRVPAVLYHVACPAGRIVKTEEEYDNLLADGWQEKPVKTVESIEITVLDGPTKRGRGRPKKNDSSNADWTGT